MEDIHRDGTFSMTKMENMELTGRRRGATLKAVNDKWPITMCEPGNCDTWAEIMRAEIVSPESLLDNGS